MDEKDESRFPSNVPGEVILGGTRRARYGAQVGKDGEAIRCSQNDHREDQGHLAHEDGAVGAGQ